jgi:hypothetical protein
MKKVIMGTVDDIDLQDGGQAKIATVTDGDGQINGLFVRIQSWDETESKLKPGEKRTKANAYQHTEFNKLIKVGRKVKITIETEGK